MGVAHYFTGKACPRGHVANRFASSHRCVACSTADASEWKRGNPEAGAKSRKAWAAANPERNKAIKSAWNKANPDSQAARARKWFLVNKEKASAQAGEYRKRTPDKQNAKAAKRRAATLRATPAWADLEAIECFYTLARIYRDFGHEVEVDHVAPLRGRNVCGLHVHQNLQVLPMSVNRSKSNSFQI